MSDPSAPLEPAAGRLAPGERVSLLWAITIAGFSAWLLVGSAYAATKVAEHGTPATQASTQPLSYTPYETVILGVIGSCAVALTIIASNILVRPGGLRRLGLGERALPRGLLIGVAASLIVIPLVYGSAMATQKVWDALGLEYPTAHPLLRIMDQQHSDALLRSMVIISAILLAPLSEELLFRAQLQTAFRYTLDNTATRALPALAAVLLTSAVFTLFHGEFWMMPPIFLLSLILGWVYERTRNLWATIVIHACFNASSVAYFLWQRPPAHH
ncbi:MAG TPA: CPBP family intramembrane glutamic endopeptidase [Tepidisphaeraceae bacterium]|jgi:hypothetical protein